MSFKGVFDEFSETFFFGGGSCVVAEFGDVFGEFGDGS